MSDIKDEFAGRLILLVPAARPDGAPIFGALIGAVNADTGQEIVTITEITLTVTAHEVVIAETTMLVHPDGSPQIESPALVAYNEDGSVPTGRFRWLVTEMRVAEGEPPALDADAERTQMRGELAEELYDRDSGTCGCGCTCAFYLDPDCDRVTS